MTIEQIVCVSFGAIIQAVVFGLGVSVGVSLAAQRGIEADSNNGQKASVENKRDSADYKPKCCDAPTRTRRAKA